MLWLSHGSSRGSNRLDRKRTNGWTPRKSYDKSAPVHLGHAGSFAFLFAVALFGGAINSVAGGGGFLFFPPLLLVRLTPLHATPPHTLAPSPSAVASHPA